MKLSYQWLKDYIDFDYDPQTLAAKLTGLGLEVEKLERVGNDWRIDIEVTSNRPDWKSHLGVAREIAAVTGNLFMLPEYTLQRGAAPCREFAAVAVEAPDLCPRYTAQILRGINVGPSPAWLQDKLKTVGLRPINNIVDITNYVMLETNQPLHAFDLAKIGGKKIIVRRGKKGERITAIDHAEYLLDEKMLVIADAQKPLAIAGVMGGADSEIGGATRDILLESAYFDALSVRRTARKLALSTDSSFRFERGIDPAGVQAASDRAIALMRELAGGEVCSDIIDLNRTQAQQREVALTFKTLRAVLGLEVGIEKIEWILSALGFELIETTRERALVRTPTWRADVAQEIDLVEEVARVVGLDAISEKPSLLVRPLRKTAEEKALDTIHAFLTGQGFYECITVSFVNNDYARFDGLWQRGDTVAARDPVRAEEGVLRRSLIPSLLEVVRHNHRNGNHQLKLYEVANCYHHTAVGGYGERRYLTLAMDGGYADAKGMLDALLSLLNIGPTRVVKAEHALLDPLARIEARGQTLGYLGECARPIADKLQLDSRPALLELDTQLLLSLLPDQIKYAPLSRTPVALRDLAVVIDGNATWEQLLASVRSAGVKELIHVQFFDQYRGAQVPVGKKSLAFNLHFQAPDRTLDSAEVDGHVNAILAKLKTDLGAVLRA